MCHLSYQIFQTLSCGKRHLIFHLISQFQSSNSVLLLLTNRIKLLVLDIHRKLNVSHVNLSKFMKHFLNRNPLPFRRSRLYQLCYSSTLDWLISFPFSLVSIPELNLLLLVLQLLDVKRSHCCVNSSCHRRWYMVTSDCHKIRCGFGFLRLAKRIKLAWFSFIYG